MDPIPRLEGTVPRVALFSVLVLPFVFAALPAASLIVGFHPADEGRALVVVNASPARSSTQPADAAVPGPVTDPVAYGVGPTATADCHVPATATIEG